MYSQQAFFEFFDILVQLSIHILTLFPEMFSLLNESIIGRAQKNKIIEVNCHNIRDYSKDKHRRVDDTPYGGGKGMLLAAPAVYNCYKGIVDAQSDKPDTRRRVIYMSPQGKVLTQKKAAELNLPPLGLFRISLHPNREVIL